ncbi:hypothetical protein [Arthrobacter sp. SO3]|uniref:hypothetical protein n=1 Tax=Arthrobacter sp. SO3 TaxID=1897057 RepID=UPI001CFF8C78|nr:hypothetical protein [Arthrobacter sp. SO3]MCB5291969.1 hypothetical protein [Arthrobacter sp. SO3]
MEPFTDSNTPPLSIAQVDWALDGEYEQAPPGSNKAAADLLALHETLLAAVITRVGEVEAAEWALDQAKAACGAQVAAALAAGVPAEEIAAAAGEQGSAGTDVVDDREPEPADD